MLRWPLPHADLLSVSGQLLRGLLESALDAADRNWDRLVGLAGFQIFPRLGVELIGASKIGINVGGANASLRKILHIPVPRPIVFDLPKPRNTESDVFDNCHGKILFR